MDFGIITKEIICTVKEPKIEAVKLFMVRFLNLDKSERNEYIVSAENRLDLGIGDYVLVIKGSPSRMLEGNDGMPVDSAISAKVDSIFIDEKYRFLI